MPITRQRLAAVALAALVWPLAGCELATANFRAEARDDWSRTFTVSAGGRFELENTNGAIEVEPASGTTLEVRAERIAKAGTEEAAKELLQQVEIVVDESAGRVRIETRFPKGLRTGGTEVKYWIKAPASVAVKLENTNGRIGLRGLSGPVEAGTTNGGVSGKGLTGPVRASTTNGGVEIDLDAVHADGVDLSTTNGGVTLRLPREVKATISASCVNGGITAGGLDLETTESTRRRLEGRLNGGGPRVRLETTNGGVRIAARGSGE
jgi:DUF4097 and DUF4098 domain-containing protein YvlB